MKLNVTQSPYIKKIIRACREMIEDQNVQVEKYDCLEKPSLLQDSVYAENLYQFIDGVSRLLDEKCLGMLLGERLFDEDESQKEYEDSLSNALVQFFAMNTTVAHFMTFHLDFIKDRVVIGLIRKQLVRYSTRYMDEIILGYLLRMLQCHLGAEYSSKKVVIHSKNVLMAPVNHNILSNPGSSRYEISINIPVAWMDTRGRPMLETTQPKQVETTMGSIYRLCRFNVTNVEWNLHQLAQECHLSKRSLQRLLTNNSTSFRQIMLDQKLEYAKSNLIGSKKTKDIASDLGFSDTTTFARFFKKGSGVTVTQFLNRD